MFDHIIHHFSVLVKGVLEKFLKQHRTNPLENNGGKRHNRDMILILNHSIDKSEKNMV